MSTIIKQWLQQKIAEMESVRDEIPFGLDEDDSDTLAALRIALASLEAEAVAWISERNLKNLGKSYSVYVKHEPVMVRPIPLYTAPPTLVANIHPLLEFAREYIESWDFGMAGDSSLLASAKKAIADSSAHQPAPVSVPECFKRLLHHAYGMTMGNDWNKGTMAGHHRDKLCRAVEDCRAAMLQGADGNSPVIPDGWVACSERMPDEGSKVIVFRPRAEESNDPPVKTATYKGGREYYHGFDCYCEPTHWMPLPAAPQQEVKS